MRSFRGEGRSTAERDRGAVLIEAAFVTPVFVLLLFAILEFGFGFADRLGTEDLSLSAARIGSASGNDTLADHSILKRVKGSTFTTGAIDMVVVYKATGPNSTVPSNCLNASQAGSCNRYLPSQFSLPETKFGCGPLAIDTAWCPTTRKTALTGANGPPDYIGVYVSVSHPTITTAFGQKWTFKFDSVIRVEPKSQT